MTGVVSIVLSNGFVDGGFTELNVALRFRSTSFLVGRVVGNEDGSTTKSRTELSPVERTGCDVELDAANASFLLRLPFSSSASKSFDLLRSICFSIGSNTVGSFS